MNEIPNPLSEGAENQNHDDSEKEAVILPQAMQPSPAHPRYRRHSLFWPIALIGFGVLLLLSNLGYFPATGWAVLWRFWPIALIALGLDVMIGRRTTGGAIASAFLLLILVGLAIGAALFAEQIPVLVELAKPAVLQYDHIEHPMNDVERAKVTIDWTSAPGQLEALQDSNNLIEGDIAYRGDLIFNVTQTNEHATVLLNTYLQGVAYGVYDFNDAKASWAVGINPKVTYELYLDVGSGSCDFNLSDLDLEYLGIDGGSGSITLSLPRSNFSGHIDGGSGSMTVIVPENVGLRLEIDRGSGSVNLDDSYVVISGDMNDKAVWQTIGYSSAEYQIVLQIDQGSGSLHVR
jgi:hypothetical protein